MIKFCLCVQATLAVGSSKNISLVQCKVGDKSPVLLCALLPDENESLQLNLEFGENEQVMFSVIGPRGVHLTGFYTAVGRKNDDLYPFLVYKNLIYRFYNFALLVQIVWIYVYLIYYKLVLLYDIL